MGLGFDWRRKIMERFHIKKGIGGGGVEEAAIRF